MNTEEAHPICHPDYVRHSWLCALPPAGVNCGGDNATYEIGRDKVTGDLCYKNYLNCHCPKH